MSAGESLLSGDPESEKTPTATVVSLGYVGSGGPGWKKGLLRDEVPCPSSPQSSLHHPQTSEWSQWSDPSPALPAPLSGRGHPEGGPGVPHKRHCLSMWIGWGRKTGQKMAGGSLEQ